jgi:Uma2 family endonuclease
LILARLLSLLHSYVIPRRLGVVLPETDLAVRENTRLRPDMGFFSAETWQSVDLDCVPVVQTPDITIEIISPSEGAAMAKRKLQAYLDWGVGEVWLIYPETRTLQVHIQGSSQTLTEGAFLVSDLISGWRIQVSEIFEDL